MPTKFSKGAPYQRNKHVRAFQTFKYLNIVHNISEMHKKMLPIHKKTKKIFQHFNLAHILVNKKNTNVPHKKKTQISSTVK